MARVRRRDRMKDDPVGDLAAVKAGLDKAAKSYVGGETVSRGGETISSGMFPMPAGYGDKPSGDVMKTDAASFTSMVEDVPVAAPRKITPAAITKQSARPKQAPPAKKLAPVFLAEKATGEDVVFLQEFLQGQGFDIGPTGADGSFGPNTTAAVKAFQKDRGLFPDGLVGDKTMTALREVQMAANEDKLKDLEEEISFKPGRLSVDLSKTRLRREPLIQRLLQLSKEDQAAVADMLNADTGN